MRRNLTKVLLSAFVNIPDALDNDPLLHLRVGLWRTNLGRAAVRLCHLGGLHGGGADMVKLRRQSDAHRRQILLQSGRASRRRSLAIMIVGKSSGRALLICSWLIYPLRMVSIKQDGASSW